jgi:hypothetical protein
MRLRSKALTGAPLSRQKLYLFSARDVVAAVEQIVLGCQDEAVGNADHAQPELDNVPSHDADVLLEIAGIFRAPTGMTQSHPPQLLP